MNPKMKLFRLIFFSVCVFCFFQRFASGEENIPANEPQQKKEAAKQTEPPVDKEGKPEEKYNALENRLDSVLKQLDKLSSQLREIQSGLEQVKTGQDAFNTRLAAAEASIEFSSRKTEAMSAELNGFNIKVKLELVSREELRKEMETLGQKIGEISDVNTQTKADLSLCNDELSNLKDEFSLMKKDLKDTQEGFVAVKKSMKKDAAAAGETSSDILNWQYWGVSAAGLALLAFILALVK